MSGDDDCIRVERDEALAVITIDRTLVANALHPAASWKLAEVFDDFAADPDQSVAILTAAGNSSFCAGTDLKVRAEIGRQSLPPTGFAGLTKRFDLDKPVIAAVNGAALGGGFEVALACDIIVASENARFGLTEVRHGLAALGGGIQRLARATSLRVATELVLTGRVLTAKEAYDLDIINELASGEDLMRRSKHWAESLLAAAPLAVRASKEVLLRGLDEASLEAALNNQDNYPVVKRMRASSDAEEGARAFVEKRKPNWSAE